MPAATMAAMVSKLGTMVIKAAMVPEPVVAVMAVTEMVSPVSVSDSEPDITVSAIVWTRVRNRFPVFHGNRIGMPLFGVNDPIMIDINDIETYARLSLQKRLIFIQRQKAIAVPIHTTETDVRFLRCNPSAQAAENQTGEQSYI